MKITVVTPSFNQAKFIQRTIDSVTTQDYPNIEYIVVDGGSIDGSVEIIKSFEPHIDYWTSEKDRGQADALAKGFAKATGDILCWVNSDDVLLPGALSHVAALFQKNPKADVVNGGGIIITGDDKFLSEGLWTFTTGVGASYNRLRYYGQDGIFQPSTFFRKSAYDRVGGVDTSLQHVMDLDLFIRLAQSGPFLHTSRILSAWRVHEDAKTIKAEAQRLKEMKILGSRYVGESQGLLPRCAYASFRVQSLFRKALSSLPVKLGLFSLPPEARSFQ